jgi:hypothetical protein
MNHIKYARSKLSPNLWYVQKEGKRIQRLEAERGKYKEGMGSFLMHYRLAVVSCLPIRGWLETRDFICDVRQSSEVFFYTYTRINENRDYGQGDPLRWPRDTLYPQTLALTSPACGGRSFVIVRLRTNATDFFFCFCLYREFKNSVHVQCMKNKINHIYSP